MSRQSLFQELEARYGLTPTRQHQLHQPIVRVVEPIRRVVQRESWQARMVHNKGGSYITAARYHSRQACIDRQGHLSEFVEAVLTDSYSSWK